MLWWLGWGVLLVVRVALLLVWMRQGGPFGYSLLVAEGAALWFGVRNAWEATEKDRRWVGLLIPLCYGVGVIVLPLPQGYPGLVASCVVLFALVLNTWALLCLQTRFTFAGSSWVSLCDWGPYQWIRHPQLAARALIILGVWVQVGNVGDGLRCLLALLFTWVVLLVEESMLVGIPDWQSYAARVRWRVLPGAL